MPLSPRMRTFRLHLTIAITFPGFLVLGYWQLRRALGGNELSWAYTFEWPLFAIYALALWWRLWHEEQGTVREHAWLGMRRRERSPKARQRSEREDADLAAYNVYLESLRQEEERRKSAS